MTDVKTDSSRLRKFKERLAAEIPLCPNNRSTREEFNANSLPDILFFYLHWRSRFVPARPRKCEVSPEVTNDKRWRTLEPSVRRLLNKAREGQSLDGHLSRYVHTRGYCPPNRNPLSHLEPSSDKDQILNLTGFHHFHLNEPGDPPSDDMLFGHVTRDRFRAIGIFNHSVFTASEPKDALISERNRMWAIYRHNSGRREPSFSIGSRLVMSSGHPMELLRWADYCWETISVIDSQLECPAYLENLYKKRVRYTKFEWLISGLDVGFLDRGNNKFVVVAKGPI